MDRSSSLTLDRRAIYNIYKACRLCSSSVGYKMPIIQSVINLGINDVELKLKIRECFGIEVSLEDRMPPLICELCIDKVNDFYEFRQLCRKTNQETRTKLGLILNIVKKDVNKTEKKEKRDILQKPITISDDEDKPISKDKHNQKPVKLKKDDNSKTKAETIPTTESGSQNKKDILDSKISPKTSKSMSKVVTEPKKVVKPGPKCTKVNKESKELKEEPEKSKTVTKAGPKCSKKISREVLKLQADQLALNDGKAPDKVLKKSKTELKVSKVAEEAATLTRTMKRGRETDVANPDIPAKKTKPTSETPKSKSKAPSTVPPEPAPPVTVQFPCCCCEAGFKSYKAFSNHMRTHPPTFTSDMLACNACRVWFLSLEETQKHHRQHSKKKPYTCQACSKKFSTYILYNEHIDKFLCEHSIQPYPDYKCSNCKEKFPTKNLRKLHKCTKNSFPCKYCKKMISFKQNVRRHESTCSAKPKSTIDPAIKARLLDMTVRLAKCDLLLDKDKRCVASRVSYNYGLDRKRIYPYLTCIPSIINIKSEFSSIEPTDAMVQIHEDFNEDIVQQEQNAADDSDDQTQVHFGSEQNASDSSDSAPSPDVRSLSSLALKEIVSSKSRGEEFDVGDGMRSNINSLIDNLDNDINKDNNDDSLDAWLNRSKVKVACDLNAFDSLKEKKSEDSNDSFSLLNPSEEPNEIEEKGKVAVEAFKVLTFDSGSTDVAVKKTSNESEVETCSENEDDFDIGKKTSESRFNTEKIDSDTELENKNYELKDTNTDADKPNAIERDASDVEDAQNNMKDTHSVADNANDCVKSMKSDEHTAVDIKTAEASLNDACEEIISNIININATEKFDCEESSKDICNDESNTKELIKETLNTNNVVKGTENNELIKDSLNNDNVLKETKNNESIPKVSQQNTNKEVVRNETEEEESSLDNRESEKLSEKQNEIGSGNLSDDNSEIIPENSCVIKSPDTNSKIKIVANELDNDIEETMVNRKEDNSSNYSNEDSNVKPDDDDRITNENSESFSNENSQNSVNDNECEHSEDKLNNFDNENNENLESENNSRVTESESQEITVNGSQNKNIDNAEAKNVADVEDKALLDELDAQIAQYGSDKSVKLVNNEIGNKNDPSEKIMLDDLIPAKNELKSLELDNISDDDFDFDL